jgi:hypothetical protein
LEREWKYAQKMAHKTGFQVFPNGNKFASTVKKEGKKGLHRVWSIWVLGLCSHLVLLI